jgi:multisubunit Na+/H+ antiporter MnhF subunit
MTCLYYVLAVLPTLVGSAALWLYKYGKKPPTFQRVVWINCICGIISGFFVSLAIFKEASLWVHILIAVVYATGLQGTIKLEKWMGRYDRKG